MDVILSYVFVVWSICYSVYNIGGHRIIRTQGNLIFYIHCYLELLTSAVHKAKTHFAPY
jgi:hypothetical protein